MEAAYVIRTQQWLEECQVAPAIFPQVLPRLATLMAPFVDTFCRQEPAQHAQTSVGGLLSEVARTNVASIASRFGQDRLPLQRFIGWAAWEEEPLRQAWRGHGAPPWGHDDGVLVCDPSAVPKSGTASVGVARQWCGRLGTVDHGPVALSVGDVSAQGHTLVDMRLSLPTAWTTEQARLQKAGGPTDRRGSRTRHQVALDMRETTGTLLPHAWMAGDDAMGRPYGVRRRLAGVGKRSRLAGPSHTLRRDREPALPAHHGQGRRPQRPWQGVETWATSLDADAWRPVDVRDGATGPLGVDVVKRRVGSRTPRRQQGHEEMVVVRRDRDRANQQGVQVDSSLSNAEPKTPLWACARGAKAEHRREACLQRRKSEAGLADYAGRHGTGWHHHHTLAFMATGLLVTETLRGKKMDPRDDAPAESPRHRGDLVRGIAVRNECPYGARTPEAIATQCACSFLSLEKAQPIGSIELIQKTVLRQSN